MSTSTTTISAATRNIFKKEFVSNKNKGRRLLVIGLRNKDNNQLTVKLSDAKIMCEVDIDKAFGTWERVKKEYDKHYAKYFTLVAEVSETQDDGLTTNPLGENIPILKYNG